MRTLTLITGLAALFFTACTATYQASVPYDDVYYSSKDKPAVAQPTASVQSSAQPAVAQPTPQSSNVPSDNSQKQAENTEYSGGQYVPQDYQQQPQSTTETYTTPDGNTYITNNYNGGFNPDDYYPYDYSARLRRFHDPYYFNNYWDDYYTNQYWYSYNPIDWGLSIYFGYNWMWPSWNFYYNYCDPWYYSPGWGMSLGWGWGYPYYSPYYSGWGGSYWYGYNYGYWDGYWGGSWDYYYNSYDNNTYYGPRTPRSSHSGGKVSSRPSFGERYTKAIALERSTKSTQGNNPRNPKEDANMGSAGQASAPAVTSRQDNPVNSQATAAGNTRFAQPGNPNIPPATVKTNKIVIQPKNDTKAAPVPNTKNTTVTRQQSAPEQNSQQNTRTTNGPQRYYAPKNVTPAPQYNNQAPTRNTTPGNNTTAREYKAPVQERYSKPKNYYSPNFTKPKSSQEYVSPKTESVPNSSQGNGRSGSGYVRPEQPSRDNYAPQRQYRESNYNSRPDRSSSGRSESSGRSSYSPSSSGSSSSGSSSGSSRSSSGSSGSGRGRR